MSKSITLIPGPGVTSEQLAAKVNGYEDAGFTVTVDSKSANVNDFTLIAVNLEEYRRTLLQSAGEVMANETPFLMFMPMSKSFRLGGVADTDQSINVRAPKPHRKFPIPNRDRSPIKRSGKR